MNFLIANQISNNDKLTVEHAQKLLVLFTLWDRILEERVKEPLII